MNRYITVRTDALFKRVGRPFRIVEVRDSEKGGQYVTIEADVKLCEKILLQESLRKYITNIT